MSNHDLLKAVAQYVVANDNEKAQAQSRVADILEALTPDLLTGDRRDQEKTIRAMLAKIGVPCHIKGHDRLVYAVSIVAEEPRIAGSITKWLYPAVAKAFGETPSRVERSIRHAIELAFDRCDPETIQKFFGNTVNYRNGKLTNGEFICRMAEIVRDRA